jgi:hypothetical protein
VPLMIFTIRTLCLPEGKRSLEASVISIFMDLTNYRIGIALCVCLIFVNNFWTPIMKCNNLCNNLTINNP